MNFSSYDPVAIIIIGIISLATLIIFILLLMIVIESIRVSRNNNAWKQAGLDTIDAHKSRLELLKELDHLEREFRIR